MIKREKIIKWAVFILILGFYSSFLVYKIKIPAADDLPRQIKIGQEVLHGNFDILYKNVFSYTEPDYTFYDHHWLSGVVFYVMDLLIGWSGLGIFKVLILLLAFSIVFKTSLKRADFWLVALASIPSILILRERTGLRPEVFSYLILSIFFYILVKWEENPESKIIYWLVPLQLLWVNMHVFFSIGIMLMAGYLFEKIVINWRNLKSNPVVKKTFIVFILVVIVSFVNPRFVGGVFYKYPTVSIGISEFQPLLESLRQGVLRNDVSIYTFFPTDAISLLSILIFFIFNYIQTKEKKYKNKYLENKSISEAKNNLPIFYILAIFATIAISFIIVRGLSFFGFVFLLVVPALLNDGYIYYRDRLLTESKRFYGFLSKIILIIIITLVVYFVYFSNSRFFNVYTERGFGLASMSEGGKDFFIKNNLKGPIFNDPDIGSYLIYYLYPREKVFSDNRFGDAYSPSFWDNIYLPILANDDKWQEALKKYNFNVIYLYQYDNGDNFRQFMYNRIHDPEWALVYGDAYSLIFLRNTPENKNLIRDYQINKDNIPQRLNYLLRSPVEDDVIAAADIFNMLGNIDLGREAFFDVVIKRPSNGKIWMIMGEWQLLDTSRQSAVLGSMFLEKALDVGYKTAESYSFLGVAYYRLGRYDKAVEVLNKSLDINPLRADSKSLLDIIANERNK